MFQTLESNQYTCWCFSPCVRSQLYYWPEVDFSHPWHCVLETIMSWWNCCCDMSMSFYSCVSVCWCVDCVSCHNVGFLMFHHQWASVLTVCVSLWVSVSILYERVDCVMYQCAVSVAVLSLCCYCSCVISLYHCLGVSLCWLRGMSLALCCLCQCQYVGCAGVTMLTVSLCRQCRCRRAVRRRVMRDRTSTSRRRRGHCAIRRRNRHYRHHWWPVHRGQTQTFSRCPLVSFSITCITTGFHLVSIWLIWTPNLSHCWICLYAMYSIYGNFMDTVVLYFYIIIQKEEGF